MSNKRINFVLVVLILLMINGIVNVLTAQSKDQRVSKTKLNFSLGKLINEPNLAAESDPVIMTNIGIGIGRKFELEANALYPPKSDDAVISSNLILNIPISRQVAPVPFVTIGPGYSFSNNIWLNLGFGLRIILGEKLGIRTEFHRWAWLGRGGDLYDFFLVGISYFI